MTIDVANVVDVETGEQTWGQLQKFNCNYCFNYEDIHTITITFCAITVLI